jgi:hypothetical protein
MRSGVPLKEGLDSIVEERQSDLTFLSGQEVLPQEAAMAHRHCCCESDTVHLMGSGGLQVRGLLPLGT